MPKKESTCPPARSFLATRRPPINTGGSIAGNEPIHQLATEPVANTAKAAGLKICFLKGAKRYFEALAESPAKPQKIKDWLCNAGSGFIKRAKIRPVIKEDSIFSSARKTRARILFVPQETAVKTDAETRKSSALNN